ncbi:hypothetical protein Drose_10925 [Dactylosporangium roseum]|uniref:Uncharacterized protein n=1 Tax=Dactylosporangium roseum TaxID=47989 RepID=A0ABY5ZAI9_9ACTN|nr:hypothetical protein [Dactylosporangium roseum]UWZ38689.1 hypothetical protein Drose_10925 [Dactylosporangium roseum]
MRTKAWQCVAGAALAIGTLSAAQAAYDRTPADRRPSLVDRASVIAGQRPDGDQNGVDQNGVDQNGVDQGGLTAKDGPDPGGDGTMDLLAASGLLAFGGVVLVGGVVGLGGLRIPGGVAMTVGRARLWIRTMRSSGAHRAR